VLDSMNSPNSWLTIAGPESPGFWVNNEAQFHASLDTHLLRYMREYLRISFSNFPKRLGTALTIRNGCFADDVKGKLPDICVFSTNARGDSPVQFPIT
jgi:hypothetical protein